MKKILLNLVIIFILQLFSFVNAEENGVFLKCVSSNLKNLEKIYYSNQKIQYNFGDILIRMDNDLIKYSQTNKLNEKDSKLFELLKKDLQTLEKAFYSGLVKAKTNRTLNYECNNILIAKKEPLNIEDFETTKIEPSQTQKVAKEKLENLYIERMVTKQEKLDFAKGKIKIYKCSTSSGTHLSKGDCIGDYYKKELLNKKYTGFLNFYLLKDYNKSQITKSATNKIKKDKTKKVKKIQSKSKKLSEYNHSELELIKRFKNYEKNCEPVESKMSLKRVICIKVTDILDLGEFREIQSFPEGMLKEKLNWTMLSKKAGQEVYSLFVKRGPQYHARYPGAMILGMSWYEIFYLNQLKKNKKVIERFITFGPDDYNKYNNLKDPLNSIKAKNFPEKLFQEDVRKISKLINNNKSKIKMREALGFSNEDKIEDVIKSQWILGNFLNNDKFKAKKVILDPELKKRKILVARYKTALTKYKKKLEEQTN